MSRLRNILPKSVILNVIKGGELPNLVILNVTEGGVRDLLYLPFHIGAKRRSTNANAANFCLTTL
jgi:hypothetical protein